jgi:regulator of protease activity HflC (stomatin/prohibitin superfamily)
MNTLQTVIVIAIVAVGVIGLGTAARAVRVVQQYERGVVFRFGRVRDGTRGPGLTLTASPATTSPYASTRSCTSASWNRSRRW